MPWVIWEKRTERFEIVLPEVRLIPGWDKEKKPPALSTITEELPVFWQENVELDEGIWLSIPVWLIKETEQETEAETKLIEINTNKNISANK